jgi:hypothetical protein
MRSIPLSDVKSTHTVSASWIFIIILSGKFIRKRQVPAGGYQDTFSSDFLADQGRQSKKMPEFSYSLRLWRVVIPKPLDFESSIFQPVTPNPGRVQVNVPGDAVEEFAVCISEIL